MDELQFAASQGECEALCDQVNSKYFYEMWKTSMMEFCYCEYL